MKKIMLGLLVLWGWRALFAQEAVVKEIHGTVEVKAPGGAVWTPARQGQTLARGDLISTGFRSTAVLTIGGSALEVRPLTRLSLEELVRTGKDEKVNINLQAGRVRADVKPPPGGISFFTVRSPTVTASVRGTAFEFDGLRLRVEEGRVHLSAAGGGGTYVGAGHIARVDTETGRTLGAAETAKEELTPPAPAGMAGAPEAVTADPAAGDIEAGFDWQ
jgi:hypothetical protein